MSFSAQNTFKNSQLVVQHAVAKFVNTCSFIHTAIRDYENDFNGNPYAPGSQIEILLDNFYKTGRGDNATAQGIQEAKMALTILPLFWAAFEYRPTDLQRNIVDFTDSVIEPAIRNITADMNAVIYQNSLTQIGYFCGSVSSPINSYSAFSVVNPFLTDLSLKPERYAVLNTDQMQQLESASSLQNSFVTPLNKDITLSANLTRLANIDIFQDPVIQPRTAGTASGTITVLSEVSSGSTITLTGLTASQDNIFLAGDLISIAGINIYNAARNQILYSRSGQFTITSAVSSDSSGNATVSIFPSIDFSTVRQNLYSTSASIPAGALVTPVGDATRNLVYTNRALVAAIPPLGPLDTVYSANNTDKEYKMSLRISRSALPMQNQNTMRIDAQMATTWVIGQAVNLVSQNIINS